MPAVSLVHSAGFWKGPILHRAAGVKESDMIWGQDGLCCVRRDVLKYWDRLAGIQII